MLKIDEEMDVGEWDSVARMIKQAEQCGLLVEVIHSFGEEMKRGEKLEQACWNALYEWDC